MVPETWKETSLNQVAIGKLTNGAFNDPKLVGQGYRLINVVDLYNPREIDVSKLRRLNLEKKDFKKYQACQGDLFFTRSSLKLEGIAHCARLREDYDDVAFECHIMRLRPDTKKVDSDFLFEYCNSHAAKKHFMRFAKTGTMTTIDQHGVSSLMLPLPPLPEQKKIAQILSTWDQAITATERLLENSQKRKKGLMQQLLTGKKRLPGFEGEWEKVRLRELLTEVKARNKDLSISRVLTVTNHSGFVLPEDHFAKRVASDNVSNYRVVRKGQYGYNPSRLNVGSFARLDSYDEGLLSPMYVVFSVYESRLNNDYFLNWMKSNEAKQRIAGSTQGSVRDSVGFDALCTFPFRLPPLDEQRKIAEILNFADREIIALKERLDLLQQEKKALMQQLLTGKRRVNVDTEAA